MKNIIRFPMVNSEDREYSDETFEWLVDRAKEYLDFLERNAPRKDKSKWCKKLIAVLKFLGDYKLEDELQEEEERQWTS